jgi:3-oxoacyl-[acyl-carrier-protein] synthase-3
MMGRPSSIVHRQIKIPPYTPTQIKRYIMTQQLPVKIAGLGWYLPVRRVPSAELAQRFIVAPGLIERTTGVRERRYASGETASGMAAAAARMALEHAEIQSGELDAIIGASSAPQQCIPCTAALVQRELGAPEGRSLCFDINATCLSFLVALQTAAQFIAAGVYRHVLIFSSEIASPSLDPNQWESAALFGDAAAAAVLSRSAPGEPSTIWHARFATYSSGADLTQCLGGGTLHHPNDPRTSPEMNMFHMQGLAVFRQAVRIMRPFLDQFFETLDWQREQVNTVVPHQASRHGVEQLSDRLGFREQQVFSNLGERGNCVAASIPLALAEAVHAGRIRRDDRVVLLGTGAGLTVGALALTY